MPSWKKLGGDAASTVQATITQSGTWTVPAGVNLAYLTMCGGGGGGRGSYLGSDGSGGGSGAVIANMPIGLIPGESITATIGAGGTAGTSTAIPTDGGASSFKGLSCAGGYAGEDHAGGEGGLVTAITPYTTGLGTLAVAGAIGNAKDASNGGAGAPLPYGYSLGGLGGVVGSQSGKAPSGYGAGGGGCYDASPNVGGAGGPGVIILEYMINE